MSIASAISACGEWNPNARRAIRRICVLICSMRALESPCWIAARIPSRCSVIVRASLTNDGSRHRRAHVSQPSSSGSRGRGGEPVDLAQLLLEQVRAVQPGVGLLDRGELRGLAVGEVLGVLPDREPGALQLAGELEVALACGPRSRPRDGPRRARRWRASRRGTGPRTGPRQGTARRSARRSSAAMSAETNSICLQRSSPSASKNASTVLRSRPGAAHTSRPV